MIDPRKITKFDRTNDELLEFWLFCLFVAGKTAKVQAQKLEDFLNDLPGNGTVNKITKPLNLHLIDQKLKEHKTGKYNTLTEAIRQTEEIIRHNSNWLKTCSHHDLESVKGCGPKTSRFFLLHSRPNQEFAVLDTHILKWLRDNHNIKVPKSTPGKLEYSRLEKKFLEIAKKQNKSLADLDLEIWNSYAR